MPACFGQEKLGSVTLAITDGEELAFNWTLVVSWKGIGLLCAWCFLLF
jgi:hypothetical protein